MKKKVSLVSTILAILMSLLATFPIVYAPNGGGPQPPKYTDRGTIYVESDYYIVGIFDYTIYGYIPSLPTTQNSRISVEGYHSVISLFGFYGQAMTYVYDSWDNWFLAGVFGWALWCSGDWSPNPHGKGGEYPVRAWIYFHTYDYTEPYDFQDYWIRLGYIVILYGPDIAMACADYQGWVL